MSQSRSSRKALARKTINKDIPSVLQSSSRAKAGVQSAQLLTPEPLDTKRIELKHAAPCIIRVVAKDTLDAAHDMLTSKPCAKVGILSMASELRPGGGFLSGASSQEESLCMRTTLYPSLSESFYRLPELSCVYTPDVCVFRRHNEYGMITTRPGEWWFIDVISAAAVRGPEIDDNTGSYAYDADRDLMRAKIKVVLRAAVAQNCRRLVLGAFGCGAFGNPPREVAQLFHRVLLGRPGRNSEFAGCFDEVTFGILGGRKESIEEFRAAFSSPDACVPDKFRPIGMDPG
ncbi:hypothetical protein EDD18DRAFT_1154654 [Armillaria luteobubalina]|uniref:Microbial-type PARG catalytic domain-containing protein n=1 Tax=Armillaria luteobubalina TaxID=153913 RepID=A0AA39UZ25_9AGAR|nr:hypothetical protein EDD18DRAFT_1154654 [Armillaria luteobubalina]